jgi:hypothetical protein
VVYEVERRLEDAIAVEPRPAGSAAGDHQGLLGLTSMEGTQLKYVNCWDVMWFSWYAFHPETEAYGG